MIGLTAALKGNHSEFEISQQFEAPYVTSATGTRRYISERRFFTDHVIVWLCEAMDVLIRS